MFPFINKFFFKVLLGMSVITVLCFATIRSMRNIDHPFWEGVAQWAIITLSTVMFTANARSQRRRTDGRFAPPVAAEPTLLPRRHPDP